MTISTNEAIEAAMVEHRLKIKFLERKLEGAKEQLASYRDGVPKVYEKDDIWVVSFLSKAMAEGDGDWFGGGPTYDIDKRTGKFVRHYETQ